MRNFERTKICTDPRNRSSFSTASSIAICNSGALWRSGAPWVRKFGYLCIREILVVTRPHVRPTAVRPHHRHTQSTGTGNSNATQGFIWWEIAWPPRLLERKNNNKIEYFSKLFLMFTLTPITEKRAIASDWKQRRRISLEEKQENFTEAVGKWEMLAASKVEMSCSKSHKWLLAAVKK